MALLLALLSHSAHGTLRLPAVISDHAMIQVGKPVAVWGWAVPGDEVSVSFAATNGKTEHIAARTAADGRWSDQVTAPDAVRYAWAFNPLLSVENSAGLPLRPFRTDTGSDK